MKIPRNELYRKLKQVDDELIRLHDMEDSLSDLHDTLLDDAARLRMKNVLWADIRARCYEDVADRVDKIMEGDKNDKIN